MHIAICDDNTADRHQLERLLKRESDKRISTTGNLYTDSYGNEQSLLCNPMQYDLFYIDVCQTENVTGLSVVEKLNAAGVHTPIVMCCSRINYREQSFPGNVFFLDKPIRTAELSQSIDHALEIKQKAPHMIELRTQKDTLYVTEPEIVYAIEEARHLTVTLRDGRKMITNTTAESLFTQIEQNPVFFAPSLKVIVNARYVKKVGLFKLSMMDGTEFLIHRDCVKYARYAYNQFHEV